jgi:hypothetical protein
MSKLLIGLLLSLSFSTYAQTLFDQNIPSHIRKVDYIEVDENGHSINHSKNNDSNTNINNQNGSNSFQIVDNKHNNTNNNNTNNNTTGNSNSSSNNHAEVLFGNDNDTNSSNNVNNSSNALGVNTTNTTDNTSNADDDGDILFDNTNKSKPATKILTVDTSAIVAFQSDNVQSVQNWLDKGTSVEMPIYDKNTLAMVAAMHSREKIFNLAIEHKANLLIKNKNNETILHWIAYNNDITLLNDFIAAIGLDKMKTLINAQDTVGRTPLHYALLSDKENPIFIERMVQLGANLNIQDNEGNTPVHMAFLKNHKDVYLILKKYNASFNIKNNGDLTPIQLALKVNSSWDFDYYNNFDFNNIK